MKRRGMPTPTAELVSAGLARSWGLGPRVDRGCGQVDSVVGRNWGLGSQVHFPDEASGQMSSGTPFRPEARGIGVV